MRRFLVVNADDFGQSAAVNAGIAEAHRSGIVTSASLMVRWPAAAEAAELSRALPDLSVGLHVDLGEWFLSGGEWLPHYEVVRMEDAEATRDEMARQVKAFHALMGRQPTHLDSHQHVHLREPVRSLIEEHAHALGIPVRRCRPEVRYCGDFYGQDEHGEPLHERITVPALISLLAGLQPGVTELSCHPAAAKDLETMYSAEREQELSVLCDPRVRQAVRHLNIELRSFSALLRQC